MITSPESTRGAACGRPENRDLPWIAEDASPLARALMARVCASCPVLASCALEVATTPTTAGFWAGHDRTKWREPVTVQDTLPGLELGAAA
ncbi:WhiB family transcriptional regulator [Promicromonospora panici]|uniref:WhiB family transcriptional regulator n=1 Tax=Promicromonospora panici TaxID=2219658 RepID=UPI00101C11B1|nr:WhiB family transcriptional regulator [Promicromonospora panici]